MVTRKVKCSACNKQVSISRPKRLSEDDLFPKDGKHYLRWECPDCGEKNLLEVPLNRDVKVGDGGESGDAAN